MKDDKGFWDGFALGVFLGFIGALFAMFGGNEQYAKGAGIGFLVQSLFIIIPLLAFNCELISTYL